MSLTPLPPAPSIDDPENFADEADVFVAALGTLVEELNTIIGVTIPAGSAAASTLTGSTLAANVLSASLNAIQLAAASTWDLGEHLEFGVPGSALWSVSQTDFRLLNNLYYNGGFKFAGTGYASYHSLANGAHVWASSTASGTAGNAATMRDLMGVDQAGTVTFNLYTAATFVAGDKYLVVDAAGVIHRSALGPAS